MKANYAFAIALTLAALAGCKNKEKDLVGSWSATNDASGMTLQIKEDKTWTASMTNGGRSIPMEGTWAFSGDVVNLAPTKLMGQSVEDIKSRLAKAGSANNPMVKAVQEMIKPDDFVLGGDGKTLTIKNPKAGQPPLVFTKSGS